MAKQPRKVLKNFRLHRDIALWLERKSATTGKTQTWIIVDALKEKYGLKGLTNDRGNQPA
jgi:hypothetical protein